MEDIQSQESKIRDLFRGAAEEFQQTFTQLSDILSKGGQANAQDQNQAAQGQDTQVARVEDQGARLQVQDTQTQAVQPEPVQTEQERVQPEPQRVLSPEEQIVEEVLQDLNRANEPPKPGEPIQIDFNEIRRIGADAYIDKLAETNPRAALELQKILGNVQAAGAIVSEVIERSWRDALAAAQRAGYTEADVLQAARSGIFQPTGAATPTAPTTPSTPPVTPSPAISELDRRLQMLDSVRGALEQQLAAIKQELLEPPKPSSSGTAPPVRKPTVAKSEAEQAIESLWGESTPETETPAETPTTTTPTITLDQLEDLRNQIRRTESLQRLALLQQLLQDYDNQRKELMLQKLAQERATNQETQALLGVAQAAEREWQRRLNLAAEEADKAVEAMAKRLGVPESIAEDARKIVLYETVEPIQLPNGQTVGGSDARNRLTWLSKQLALVNTEEELAAVRSQIAKEISRLFAIQAQKMMRASNGGAAAQPAPRPMSQRIGSPPPEMATQRQAPTSKKREIRDIFNEAADELAAELERYRRYMESVTPPSYRELARR